LRRVFAHREVVKVDGLSVGLSEVFAGRARWGTYAAAFADVVPPAVTGTWPSAAAVATVHADVAASQAAFGARLLDTAGRTQRAGISYAVMDAQDNAQAIEEVVEGGVRP
jgi:hypothetical protein